MPHFSTSSFHKYSKNNWFIDWT